MSLIILETILSYSANTKGKLMTSFLYRQRVGFWLSWILQIEENNRFLYIPIPDKSVLQWQGFWLPCILQIEENNRFLYISIPDKFVLQGQGFWLPWILQIEENNRFFCIPIPDKSVLQGQGFWLPWIHQTQGNNRTSLHNNTCQIRSILTHTTTCFLCCS